MHMLGLLYVLFSPGMSSFSTKNFSSRQVFQMCTNVQVVDCLVCCKAFTYFNGINMQNFNSAKNMLRACLTLSFIHLRVKMSSNRKI